MAEIEITIPSIDEVVGDDRLNVYRNGNNLATLTDLAILTGGFLKRNFDHRKISNNGYYWTKTPYDGENVCIVNPSGNASSRYLFKRNIAIRPVIKCSDELFSKIYDIRNKRFSPGIETVYLGEYPQFTTSYHTQVRLEIAYSNEELIKTGKWYTFDSTKVNDFDTPFTPVKYDEYVFEGKKYIRVKANADYEEYFKLSNEDKYENDKYVWLEVSPVIWLIDQRRKTLVSKYALLSGIRFMNKNVIYHGDFSITELKDYLDVYMLSDILLSMGNSYITKEKEEKTNKRKNPYNFNLNPVSEEDIIRGSIESNIAVFLHGQSSEGKSARVKEIDPDCIILYLRNTTPDSLNGKTVYDSSTGEMIDIKPSWLKKLEEKCESEPDKLHILFFDELTNALPSIQGMAFNIILNKEVNGIWKLPDNARIVAAGNEMKDSISANQMAEPLFNRFAHVYIKTTPKSWLEWASKNNIHPAIYSFVAYKKGEVLRSKFDGEKPNADPRKWEMASNMLYATGQPDMLRSLVGEDITREFLEFCNQQVITLDDVITGKYTNKEIEALNTAERYATVMSLSQVDEENLKAVRDFVSRLGKEYVSIFDSMWTHGDEAKLERLAEAKISEETKKLVK